MADATLSSHQHSKWEVTIHRDAPDGVLKTTIITRPYGDRLIVRCGRKVHAALIPWHDDGDHADSSLLVDDMHAQWIRYQIDSGPARMARWVVSDHFDALVLPLQAIASLRHGRSLAVYFHPVYQPARTAVVSLDGLANEMSKAGCPI